MMQNRFGRAIPTIAAALFLSVISAASQAQITFTTGSGGGNPPENVLMDSESGFNVFGHTNQTNKAITFTSDEDIVAGGQGQASVEPKSPDHGYKMLCMEIVPGYKFTDLKVDVDVYNGDGDGNITWYVYGVGTDLPAVFNSTVDKNGSNWFRFTSTGDTKMTKVCLETDVDIAATKQWRVGGVGLINETPPSVPEGSSALLLGTGLLPFGAMIVKRRRAAKS